MKNREKYAEQILDIVCSGARLAMRKDDKCLTACAEISCDDCWFGGTGRCDEVTYKWAESEYIEPVKISKKDRAFLDYLGAQWKYIARDKDGGLNIYTDKVYKGDAIWEDTFGLEYYEDLSGFNVDFSMVNWSDKEPWLIEDLKGLDVCENYEID